MKSFVIKGNICYGKDKDEVMTFHNIPPVFNANSRYLILGSFSSVRSRQAELFYAHPQKISH